MDLFFWPIFKLICHNKKRNFVKIKIYIYFLEKLDNDAFYDDAFDVFMRY